MPTHVPEFDDVTYYCPHCAEDIPFRNVYPYPSLNKPGLFHIFRDAEELAVNFVQHKVHPSRTISFKWKDVQCEETGEKPWSETEVTYFP